MLPVPLLYDRCLSARVCMCCVMEDTRAVRLTMPLCCSSASEDLGCRRGDFSRKHYGSVELVSLILCALFVWSSLSSPPSLTLCFSPLCWHGRTTEKGWGGIDESWRTGCGPAMCFASAEHSGRSTRSHPGSQNFICVVVKCVFVCLCGWLLSCWVIAAQGGSVLVFLCENKSFHCEPSLCIPIAQRDRKS